MQKDRTPLERIEALGEELLEHYGDGDDREMRVAAKMLLIALDLFRKQGGRGWPGIVREYLSIAEHEPEKFEDILAANRSKKRKNNI